MGTALNNLETMIAGEIQRESFWSPTSRTSVRNLKQRITAHPSQKILFCVDNAAESEIDLLSLVYNLLEHGHQLTIAAKTLPASNDSTKTDIPKSIADASIRARLGEKIKNLRIIDSGTL